MDKYTSVWTFKIQLGPYFFYEPNKYIDFNRGLALSIYDMNVTK